MIFSISFLFSRFQNNKFLVDSGRSDKVFFWPFFIAALRSTSSSHNSRQKVKKISCLPHYCWDFQHKKALNQSWFWVQMTVQHNSRALGHKFLEKPRLVITMVLYHLNYIGPLSSVRTILHMHNNLCCLS